MPLLQGPEGLANAAAALAAGELVAFPTETVYGLGARADDDAAVARIFAAKGRPSDHPLIVHVASVEAAAAFAGRLPASALQLMQAFWPGPVTVIVPRRDGVGNAAAAGQPSIGLRMPSHPLALALLRKAAALGVPGVAGPSANRFGRVSPTRAAHVLQEFGPELRVLDGGDCDVGIESAIVDCTRGPPAGPALLRPGQIARERLERALGLPLVAPDAASPRAPGTLASHYAPRAALRLLGPEEWRSQVVDAPAQPGVALYARTAVPAVWWHRPMAPQADAVAHELFSVLRELDEAGAHAIWVEAPPSESDWDGVRDRLRRAAT